MTKVSWFAPVLCAIAGSGCLALSARVHADVVADAERNHATQVALELGFGYAHEGLRSATTGSLGIATGSEPVAVRSAIDHIRLPGDTEIGALGWRLGFGGSAAMIGDLSVFGVRGGMLVTVHDRVKDDPGHEKIGLGSSRRTVVAVGLGATLGGTARDTDGPGENETQLGGSVGVSIELYSLGRMQL